MGIRREEEMEMSDEEIEDPSEMKETDESGKLLLAVHMKVYVSPVVCFRSPTQIWLFRAKSTAVFCCGGLTARSLSYLLCLLLILLNFHAFIQTLDSKKFIALCQYQNFRGSCRKPFYRQVQHQWILVIYAVGFIAISVASPFLPSSWCLFDFGGWYPVAANPTVIGAEHAYVTLCLLHLKVTLWDREKRSPLLQPVVIL